VAVVGLTLGGDAIARWLEAGSPPVAAIEVVAEGVFGKPSPYLEWLGTRFDVLVRAAELPIGVSGPSVTAKLDALQRVCRAASAGRVVCALGFREAVDIKLPLAVPISLTRSSLDHVVGRVVEVATACDRPVLVEPVFSALHVPGGMDHAEFLAALCQRTGVQLLVDVAALLAAHENRAPAAKAWLQGLQDGLIGAVRVSGSSRRRGRWHRDPGAPVADAAWELLAETRLRGADLVLLDRQEGGLERDAVALDLERLERCRPAPASGGAAAQAPTASTLRPAQDVALFVLDRQGVFYSASRRELTLFNTPATFVWCLVDEGRTIDDIAAAYATAFELPSVEARRCVGTILRHWVGRGYVEGAAAVPGGDAVPFTTALALVLTNPRLRASFAQKPHHVARTLGLGEEDAALFAALPAADLDRQADELHEASRRLEPSRWQDGRTSDRPAAPASTAQTRHYRLVSTTFAIEASSQDASDALHAALGHLLCDDAAADVVLRVRTSASGGWDVHDGEGIVAAASDRTGLVPAIKQLIRRIAVDRHPFLVSVHAGAVSFGRGGLLLPAAPGSGKTTLTAGLAHAGATYFSDEIALLEPRSLAVTPVPLSLTIKDGAVDPLRSRFPELDTLPVHRREDHVRVRYLPPPIASRPASACRETVKWIVFPRYAAGGDTALVPLDRPAALARLLDEAYVDRRRLDRRNAESLVQWMRGVDCFDLPMAALAPAVDLLKRLAGGVEAPA
jgi:uncharacterized protein (UPF0276 family)